MNKTYEIIGLVVSLIAFTLIMGKWDVAVALVNKTFNKIGSDPLYIVFLLVGIVYAMVRIWQYIEKEVIE